MKYCWLTAIFSFFVFFSLGFAQSIDTTLQFPTVEINAPRQKSFKTGIKNSTFTTFQQLSATNQDLATALTFYTPIFIKNYGPSRLASTAIRGASAAQTAVIWNGFNLNTPMLGQTDFSLIPTFFMDEIGVQYGSNSTAWGSGAIGGSIILGNKNQFDRGWQGEWSSSSASFDNFFNGLGIGFSNTRFATTTKAFYQSAQNDFPIFNARTDRLPHSEMRKWGVLQKNSFKLKTNQQLDINVWYQTTDRNLPPNLVQRLSVAEQEDESLRTTLNWKLVGKKSILQIRSGLFYERLFFQDAIANLDSRSRTWTSSNEVEWTKTITKNHSIHLGGNVIYLKAKSTEYGDLNPTQNRASIFAMYCWKNASEKWTTQLSLRQEWVDGVATPFIPALGFSGALSDKWALHGNVSKSYRVPTFNDLFWQLQGNQSLLSENGWNQELFLQYLLTTNWRLETTAYNRTIDNWILWQPENGIWRPNNLLKVWSRGVENKINWQRAINNWQLNFSIQYDLTLSTNQKGRNENDASVNKQLIYVPQHQVKATLQADWHDWTFAFYHQFTGKVYTLADNSDALPSYHLDHLSIFKKVKIRKTEGHVFGRINNVFGVNYQVVAQFPMPWQNYEVGWSIKF